MHIRAEAVDISPAQTAALQACNAPRQTLALVTGPMPAQPAQEPLTRLRLLIRLRAQTKPSFNSRVSTRPSAKSTRDLLPELSLLPPTLAITQRAVTTTLPGSPLISKHIDSFNTYGMPTQMLDYDYGSGAPGALLRQIL
jgi:hypothetical protein